MGFVLGFVGSDDAVLEYLSERWGMNFAEHAAMCRDAMYNFTRNLAIGSPAMEYLHERGIGSETSDLYSIGADSQSNKVVFPVYSHEGFLMGFKTHKGPHYTDYGELSKTGGGVKATLYGWSERSELNGPGVEFICEGEPDVWALHAHTGFTGVTSTAGAGVWKPEWKWLFRDKIVYTFFDSDEPGMRGREDVRSNLVGVVRELRSVSWPRGFTGDLTDWFASYQGDGPDFGIEALRALEFVCEGVRKWKVEGVDFKQLASGVDVHS